MCHLSVRVTLSVLIVLLQLKAFLPPSPRWSTTSCTITIMCAVRRVGALWLTGKHTPPSSWWLFSCSLWQPCCSSTLVLALSCGSARGWATPQSSTPWTTGRSVRSQSRFDSRGVSQSVHIHAFLPQKNMSSIMDKTCLFCIPMNSIGSGKVVNVGSQDCCYTSNSYLWVRSPAWNIYHQLMLVPDVRLRHV